MTTGLRRTHDFCWINLMTHDAEGARAYFASLFGWTYGEMPGVPGGELILVDGLAAGALMDLVASRMPPEIPPSIGVLIKVEDAVASSAKATALGGNGGPVFDALENGRMSMCSDPNGAVFGLWQAKKQGGFEVDSHAHGAPTWFETLTTDVGRAARFYGALFGWTVEEQPMPGMTYTRFSLGSVPIGGAMPIPPNAAGAPPHWGTYFAVRDVDLAARVGAERGGTLCMPPQDIPGVGRFAMLKSPQGVSFHIIQYSR